MTTSAGRYSKMECRSKLRELRDKQRDMRNVFIKCIPPSIDSAAYPVLFHGLGSATADIRMVLDNELKASSPNS